MRMGRPKAGLVLSEDERAQLLAFARSRSLPAALVRRAQIVLASAAGEANKDIAARLALTQHTVGKSGALASSSVASRGCMTMCARAQRAASMMSALRI